jgi:glutamate formiminotransferase
MLEAVINISEGQRPDIIEHIAAGAGAALLDVHRDPDHHRAVLTVVGEDAARAVAAAGVATLDLRGHHGVHPRIGVVDVVPFVALRPTPTAEALAARDRFAAWAGDVLGVPCFLYGPERNLPDIRRTAWHDLVPDTGPAEPHPTAGAIAVGVRPPLIAYNLWLASPDLALARRIAADLRGPAVRALGLAVGAHVQVSMNLIDPETVGPAAVYDTVAAHAAIARAELVGLVPAAVLGSIDEQRWQQLDLAPERTIERRVHDQGLNLT